MVMESLCDSKLSKFVGVKRRLKGVKRSLGVPCVANMVLSFSIVGCASVDCDFVTPGYLVCLSTATRL